MAGDPQSFESIGEASKSKRNAQWWLIFAIMVANKPAEITERKVNSLLGMDPYDSGFMPFDVLQDYASMGKLRRQLEEVASGQYTRIERALQHAIRHPSDPRHWSFEELESIPGVGPKTARWYWLLLYPDAPMAALDTHVLKYLRDNGHPDAPKNTPAYGRKYRELEKTFVSHARRLGLSPRDLDYFVWATYRAGGNITGVAA